MGDRENSTPDGESEKRPETAASAPRPSDPARRALQAARERAAARGPRARSPRGDGTSAGLQARLRRKRWSAAGPDRRDPQPLGLALRGFVKNSGAATDLTKANLLGRWADIVGPGIAEHATPVNLVDGELTVSCESTAWAAQLRMLSPQLLRTINDALGRGAVKRIKATGPAAPSWRFGPRHIPGRGPRDTYG